MRESDRTLWQTVMDTMEHESLEFGPYFAFQVRHDIKHLLFTLSRYKFVTRMIDSRSNTIPPPPKKKLLELGCNEGVGTLFFAQEGLSVKAVDFDEQAVGWARKHLGFSGIDFQLDNFLGQQYGEFDYIVSLDVIEHIETAREREFLDTVLKNLKPGGAAFIGTPNVTAQSYASEASRVGHINLYDQARLKELLLSGFENVFLFGLNDEVIHTGFAPMCHYIMALACGKR